MHTAPEAIAVTLHIQGSDRQSVIRKLCAALPGCEVAWVNSFAQHTDLELVVNVAPERIAGALWLAADRIGWDLLESTDAGTFTATPRVARTVSARPVENDIIAIA